MENVQFDPKCAVCGNRQLYAMLDAAPRTKSRFLACYVRAVR